MIEYCRRGSSRVLHLPKLSASERERSKFVSDCDAIESAGQKSGLKVHVRHSNAIHPVQMRVAQSETKKDFASYSP